MKKILSVLMLMVLTLCVLTACGKKEEDNNATKSTKSSEVTSQTTEKSDESSSSSDSDTELLSGKHHVEIDVKDYGTIAVELDADVAPISVTNFVKLTKEGFYDKLTFHRVITGFMIQGVDPEGTGFGGSDETIKGEFSENGVKNDISHVRGVISMARSSDYDSASSQFFIVQSDSTYLDGQYAGFGKVTDGMDIVDKICEDTPVTDSNGTVEADKQPVINTIKVID